MAAAEVCSAALAALLVACALAQSSENLDQTSLYGEQCLRGTKDGLCLKDYQCLANYTMAIGGDIIPSSVRDGGAPVTNCGTGLWCCTYPEDEQGSTPSPTPKPTPSPTPSPPVTQPSTGGSCSRVFDECPWCVALYREGGDVSRGQRTESGLYCGGALVGKRVVLTATTCVRAVQRESVRARLPLGDSPDHYYSVVGSVMHPNYTSGNHANDFALMILNEDVRWDLGSSGAACMEFRAPQGDCQIVGLSQEEEIVMSAVTVRDGPCRGKRGGGRGAEVACATATGDCSAVTGAPLLCPITKDGQGGMAIAGVARLPCLPNGKVLLGKVQSHSDWLTRELKKQGVEPLLYIP